jgi:protein SCO1/2
MTRRQILLFLCLILISSRLLVREAWAGRDKTYLRTLENYEVPDVTLINQDGVKVNLRRLLTSDNPILVDFVYTTCTTICPVLSINFANFQKTIIEEHGTTRLVSISIDPEFDTPKAMKTYLKRYHAKPGWDYLTGSRADISRVLKAFNVFTQDKMNHYPVILLKSPVDKRWVRVNGLVGTSELLVEYEKVRK